MDKKEITLMEAARRLAELGQAGKALEAYALALKQEELAPEDRLEAACAVFQYGEDYKNAYDAFLALYRQGHFREDVLRILTEAFYNPNVKLQKKRYEKNCKLLSNYQYLFRKDFLPFEELPVKFYPYDDNGVLPFYTAEERFDEYTDVREPKIRHWFFRDLEKPVLAHDIFSQYELEYLKDNVRRSDWVARENHIYLHYASWGEFCSWLQCLDMKPLLEEEKFVFLIGDELSQYPIDFKERFGIDYSQYPVKPIGIREVNRLIWHTQLHAHNGGDFFNEILHGHPNLFSGESILMKNIMPLVETLRDIAQKIADSKDGLKWNDASIESYGKERLDELVGLKRITLKDAFVLINLQSRFFGEHIDPSERIVPAILFQPHFGSMNYEWKVHESGAIQYSCDATEAIRNCGMFEQFKYVKTFTPFRRPTTSHAATVKFMNYQLENGINFNRDDPDGFLIIFDVLIEKIRNRSVMAAKGDPLFEDSCIVRFEDAKLNPKATFTALAEFLDVPYTESMTYCSDYEGRDPRGIGFSTEAVYRTYDEFCDVNERKLLEYLLRDIYETYGYNCEQYDGKPMTQEEVEELLGKCNRNLELLESSWWHEREKLGKKFNMDGELLDIGVKNSIEKELANSRECRLLTVRVLKHGLSFCNEKGQKLEPIPMLKLDPDLLEQPLYH